MIVPHIFVTGSSRGIGAATRRTLEARGAKVLGHSRSPSLADAHANDVGADLAEPQAPALLWAQALELAQERAPERAP